MLFDGDGRRFAAGADHHDTVGALGHMPVDQGPQGRQIQAAVFEHGRDDSHDAAAQAADAGRGGVGLAGRVAS